MLKKIFPYFAVIFISICIFICGFCFGIRVYDSMMSKSMLEDNIHRVIPNMHLLNYLDEGKEENARQYLVNDVNASIISINELIKYGDEQSYKTACKILYTIAKHRKEHPDKYATTFDKDITVNVNKDVAKILNNWESCKK